MSERRRNMRQKIQRDALSGSGRPPNEEKQSRKDKKLEKSKIDRTNQKRVKKAKITHKITKRTKLTQKIFPIIQTLLIQATFTSFASHTQTYPSGDLSTLCDDYKHLNTQRLAFGAWIKLNSPLNAGEPARMNDFLYSLSTIDPNDSFCEAFESPVWMFIGHEYKILSPLVCQTKFSDPLLTCCLKYETSFINFAAVNGQPCNTGSTQNFGNIFGVDLDKEITENDSPPSLNSGTLVDEFRDVFSVGFDLSDVYRQNLFFMVMAGEPGFLVRNSFTNFAPNYPPSHPLAVNVTINTTGSLDPKQLENSSTTDPDLWRGVYESITPFGLRLNGENRTTNLSNFEFFLDDLVGCATITTSFVLVNHKDDPIDKDGGFVDIELHFVINNQNVSFIVYISRDHSEENEVVIDVLNADSHTATKETGELKTVDGWKEDDFITIWATFHFCPFLSNYSIFVNGVIEGQHSKKSASDDIATLSFNDAGYHFSTQMVPDQKIELGIKTKVSSGDDEGLRIYLKEVVQISGGYSPYLVDKNSMFSSAIPHSGMKVLGLDAANQIVPACENFYYVDENLDFGKGCVNTGNGVGGCVEMRNGTHCDRCESSTYFENKVHKVGDGGCRARSGGCEQPGYLRYSEDECSSCSTSLGGCYCNEYQEKTYTGGCQCEIKNCKK